MPVALHALPEHLSGQHTEGKKQRRCAVAFAIMGHGGAAPLLQWKTSIQDLFGLCCSAYPLNI